MGSHIEVINLALSFSWKTYHKQIFNDLNFCVERGSYVTITGANGTGKSSLVKLLLGLIPPDTGQIIIDDEAVRPGYPDGIRKGRIRYLSQHIEAFFFGDTVQEELMHRAAPAREGINAGNLHRLGLSGYLERSIETLSGGERQALGLVEFMGNNSDLLLLDEPSSYLDQEKATVLKDYLNEAHGGGKTIVHLTQYPSEVQWGTHCLDLNQRDPKMVQV